MTKSDTLTKLKQKLRTIERRLRYYVSRISTLWGDERSNYPGTIFGVGNHANLETVAFVRSTASKIVAEIGIYQGDTSLELAKILNGSGELHLFDFQDRVDAVEKRIRQAGFHNIKTYGNSYKLLDSYNWPLAKLIEKNSEPIYDYVFMDGNSTFAIDGLAFSLADRLLKVGGYIDFDNYDISLGSSATFRPERFPLIGKLYTREQIDTKQVKMIVDLLVRKSRRYTEIVPNKIFKKTM
jgi:predicted O-methyltransferase YrrM